MSSQKVGASAVGSKGLKKAPAKEPKEGKEAPRSPPKKPVEPPPKKAVEPPPKKEVEPPPKKEVEAPLKKEVGAPGVVEAAKKKHVVVKVAMVGDSQIGKTSLMVKYAEGSFDEDYIQTLGVNFMEKSISLKNTDITFSVWDLGGQQEYLHMLPLVCNEAVALLFMFDLSRKSTLTSIKNWYKQARLLNKTATPFIIGTKFDTFLTMKMDDKIEITKQARRFATAMKAPLIFCSSSHSINIHKIFKVVLSKVFDLQCSVAKIHQIGDPIIEY
jgi:GTP-binding protein of the ras superfamily involved in termination of M-phase